MADKAAIMRALMEAMGESGKTMSDADRARQRAMDRASMLEAMESGRPMRAPRRSPLAPMKSLRPKARPETIGGMPGGSTRGVNPAENYSPEDFKRLLSGYEKGGAVKKRRLANKPRKGCVMAGRGGKFKGLK